MKATIDAKAREATVTLSSAAYSDEAVRIAAATFDARCEVYHEEGKGNFTLTLAARRKDLDAKALEALAGDFLNELLNQEYRFLVARFNRRVADLVVTQALLSARGGEAPAEAAKGEDEPAFKAEVARLMSEAAAEIKKTMPKRLPPQKGPILPVVEHPHG